MLAVGAQFGSGNVLGCCSVASRKGSLGYEPRAGKHWCWTCHACHSPILNCTGNLHRELDSNYPLRPHSADVACRGFAGAVFTPALADPTVGRLSPAMSSATVIGASPGDARASNASTCCDTSGFGGGPLTAVFQRLKRSPAACQQVICQKRR